MDAIKTIILAKVLLIFLLTISIFNLRKIKFTVVDLMFIGVMVDSGYCYGHETKDLLRWDLSPIVA